jgi:hypothetical protein
MSTSFESTNYLDDSDFLSSDDETGYYSSEEENNTPLIESIIKKDKIAFNNLIKTKNNLNETIFDTNLDKKLNPLQVALKNCCTKNDFTFVNSLLKLNYYEIDDTILFCVFNEECYKYYKENIDNIYSYINPITNDTILIWACIYSNLKIVYDIYYEIKDKTIKNTDGLNYFLATALNTNSKDIFEILNFIIDNDKDIINTVDNNNDNFINLIENNKSITNDDNNKTIIIKLLVDNNININNKNIYGKNILMNIIENTNFKNWKHIYDYFYFYIKNSIDLEIHDKNNLTILDHCIDHIEMEIKLTSKMNKANLKKEFTYIRNIINLIIENKDNLNDNEKKLLMKFKKNMIKKNMI